MAESTRGQKRREYQKMYREAHREEKQEWSRLYWLENKDAINAKRSQKLKCNIRGGSYTLRHKSTHVKSERHQETLNNTSDTSLNIVERSSSQREERGE